MNAIVSRAECIDLSATERYALQAVRLGRLLNEPKDKKWTKATRQQVRHLLDEVSDDQALQPYQSVWLQYEARHLVACNEVDEAEGLFKQALDACNDRNYGRLRGEIALNGFACLLANRTLNPKNDERYYRNIMEYPVAEFTGDGPFIDIELVANSVRGYFWSDLYRPYPGLSRLERVAL